MRFPRAAALILILTGIFLLSGRAETWEQPSGNFVKLRNCRLIDSGANDGDSFMVRFGDRSFLFRLYSVDSAETTMNYPERVAAQAQHFGVTPQQAVQSGLEAEKFTKRLLVQPFTVETCWQDAKGASHEPRYYAVITLADGRDLSELLAGAGLARVYGWTPTTPGFSLPELQALERQARSRKLGAYGNGQSPVSPAVNSTASRLPPTISAFATPSATPAPAASTVGKVNVNTATVTELDAVPGIGPKYAAEIIAGRPYASVDDLVRVKGINARNLPKFAPYLSVGP